LTLAGALTLEQLAAAAETERRALLAPVDALLSSFPIVRLNDRLAQRFLHGQRLALGTEEVCLPSCEGRVRVYHAQTGQLLGTAQLQPYSVLAPERLVAAVDRAATPCASGIVPG
jgi:tRNA pseudouridine55 synthase